MFAVRGPYHYFEFLVDLGQDESVMGDTSTFISSTQNSISVNISYSKCCYSHSNNGSESKLEFQKFDSKFPYAKYQYAGDYEFSGAVLVIDEQTCSNDVVGQESELTIKLNSLDLTPLYNYLASLDLEVAFKGFSVVYPTTNDVTITHNIVSSGENYLPNIPFESPDFADEARGCILKAVWGDKVTTVQTTFESVVTGDNASAVFVYIMSADGVVTQFALVRNASTVLTQTIGDTITILVSKPYMWSMRISGADGTQNGTRYAYTVPSSNCTITINLSGGSGITNNTLVV